MTDQHQVEILLVEDDSADAELTLRAFKARNFANQVFVARDGAEALDFFFGDGSHPLRDIGVVPKVVLLDLKLPKVDGLEVLRRLRADDRTRRIPVVMLASMPSPSALTPKTRSCVPYAISLPTWCCRTIPSPSSTRPRPFDSCQPSDRRHRSSWSPVRSMRRRWWTA